MEEYQIKYHPKVVKIDIPKLAPSDARRIKKAIEEKLTTFPHIYGIPLRSDLFRLYKLRVGDFRVIYWIKDTVIYITMIEHRSIVYQNILRRI